ncbi:putative ATP-dependent RNA helicase DHX58 [Scleropages formosus]|uniref:RNA helicase n=1 Tax=Scleropages formosus TaxID=113540 RepID=A0A0P7XJT1_SCLFO|nr:putative ATP-dependent RNA helicase DHX58 [Scleropages formosus]
MEEIRLYRYQEEVVRPALEGKNIIIWLPTGGGKTRAAVYVTKRHLETKPGAKVAVLVNKHYTKEFSPFLGRDYRVVSISGDSSQKDFFGSVVQDNDVVICTAQILENAMENKEEGKHVKLTDFTLLIFDECHHTHKESVYNKIMGHYVERRLARDRDLPQVLGLTASPGTGGAKTLEKAKEHVLQICANLDASAITSSREHAEELRQKVPRPRKEYDIVEQRVEDPFGDHLKWMMKRIHAFMDMEDNCKPFGTQEYEAEVVLLEKRGVMETNRLLAQCALHLRKYNDALLVNDTVRMVDALRLLDNFYSNHRESRTGLDGTDVFLFGLFEGERDRLSFITHYLYDWVLASRVLQKAGVKAAILTGAGNQANHMTQNDQKRTIQRFREGVLNLLVSTSVAEEGLDIPECNLVVRYGLLTNEIAMQQASGRARAENSVYSVVALKDGREQRREKTNEYLEELTRQAVSEVQRMAPRDFQLKIRELQRDALVTRRLAELRLQDRRRRYPSASVTLSCRTCNIAVACGSDIQVIENTHYVNINPNFKMYYRTGGQVQLTKTFEDWTPGRKISCADCGKEWGMEMIYKNVTLPNLAIKSFALATPDGREPVKKWKDVQFAIEEFDYSEYCLKKFPDLLHRKAVYIPGQECIRTSSYHHEPGVNFRKGTDDLCMESRQAACVKQRGLNSEVIREEEMMRGGSFQRAGMMGRARRQTSCSVSVLRSAMNAVCRSGGRDFAKQMFLELGANMHALFTHVHTTCFREVFQVQMASVRHHGVLSNPSIFVPLLLRFPCRQRQSVRHW